MPWFNYLANKFLLSAVSNTLSGQALVKDNNGNIFSLLANSNSRLIYIRDNDSGEFWTFNWLPIKHQYDYFEAKHALGYSQISSSNTNIDCSLTIAQATESPLEIWQVKIGNGAERKRRLSVFVVAQWPEDQVAEQQSISFYKRVLIQSAINIPADKQLVRFMTSNDELEDYDGLRTSFLGEYGDFIRPKAVVDGKVSKSKTDGQATTGCLQKNIVLGNKASYEFSIFVGGIIAKNHSEKEKLYSRVQEMIKPYLKKDSVESLIEQKAKTIRSLLEQRRLNCPEQELNRYYNFFLQYQALLRADWPAATVESAKTNHEAITAVAPSNSDRSEAILFSTLKHQLKDGRVANSWQGSESSITATANCADSLHLASSVVAQINETGELSLLRCPVEYLDGGQGSILEHSIKAIEYVLESQGYLESTALAFKLIATIKKLEPILEKLNEDHLVKKYHRCIETITKQSEKMWRSPWYSRGIIDKNYISTTASEHSFDLETQIWAVLSDVANTDRSKQLVEKLTKQSVATPPLNLTPAYRSFSPSTPDKSQTAPGAGLNSVVETGLVIEAVKAAIATGSIDVAWRWFKQVSAIYSSNPVDRYMAEPFWQMITINGPESSLSGKASTNFINEAGSLLAVLTEDIFGIQPTIDGILINPCIPKSWRGAELSRRFRGADYQIRIENPFRVSSGIDRIIVDGIRITGTLIRPFGGGMHFIEIILG